MINYKAMRQGGFFTPRSKTPFKLSRTRIDDFLHCPRCFYLDRRLGLNEPSGPPFNLNTAVDKLLKKEFDIHRAKQVAHPLMKAYGLTLVPFRHENMDKWRENFVGVQYLHKATNFLVTGAVDDVWTDKKGVLYIVDYKSTSKAGEITLEDEWKIGYKRQMEVYQWLMRQNGFKVSDTGYFVYCNGRTDREAFDGKLEFDVTLLPYKGDDAWVEPTLIKARKCLASKKIPKAGKDCPFCQYSAARWGLEK